MSRLMSAMAVIWSSVSVNSKASSNSRCQLLSAEKAWPSRGLARGVELEQLVGHVLHGLLHARLGLLPLLRAQPVQHRLHALRRAVLLHQVEARERHVEPRALGVLQHHELGGGAVFLRNFLQPLVLADAVLDVHHVIADREIAEVGEKRRHLRLLPLRTRPAKLPARRTDRATPNRTRFASGSATPSGTYAFTMVVRRNVVGEVGGLVHDTLRCPAWACGCQCGTTSCTR